MALYLGCSVWGLKEWVGGFFPSGTPSGEFLHTYSRRLNMVEGNTTLYAMPQPDLMRRWRDDTPEGFRFCFKFPRAISHEKMLLSCIEETRQWVSLLRLLGDRAGPSFLQLPPAFGPDRYPILAEYLSHLPSDLRFAVEARHPGWFRREAEERLDSLLAERGIARVIYDVRGLRAADPSDPSVRKAQEKKPNLPVHVVRTAPFTLVRIISHPEIGENRELLDEWAERTAAWLNSGDDIYFCMHNKEDVKAPALCRDFHQRVERRIALPSLPNWQSSPLNKQLSLFG